MTRMRRAALTLALVGCNQVYGLDATSLDEPTECATIRFGAPTPVEPFAPDGNAELDAQLSQDGLELWFVYQDSTSVIYRATRSSRDEAFGAPIRAPFAQTRANDPALSGNGQRLMFIDQ